MSAAISGGAEFELRDGARFIRWSLYRTWDESRPRAIVCGANPSDADGERNDPTIHSVVRLLRPHAGGFVMVNPIPLIGADPRLALAAWRHLAMGDRRRIEVENLGRVRAIALGCAMRLVAWGNLIDPGSPHARAMLDALAGTGPLYCWGTNADGSPRHPLARGRNRIPSDFAPIVWKQPGSAAA